MPPDPELMGCFGVARLVLQKQAEGLIEAGDFDLDALIDKQIAYKKDFTCKSCDNLCTIRRLEVAEHRYPFGGRCSLYTNQRKKRAIRPDGCHRLHAGAPAHALRGVRSSRELVRAP